MKFFRSIYIKVSLLLIANIFLIISIESIVTFYINKNKAIKNIKEYANNMSIRLVNNLSELVWSYSTENIKICILQEMSNEDVLAIVVKNEKNKFMNGFSRNSDWSILNLKSEDEILEKIVFLKITKEITKRNFVIGSVDIYITDYFLNPSLKNLMFKVFGIAMLVSVFMLVSIFFGLKRLILDPIFQIKTSVERFSKNDFTNRCAVKTNDELGDLGESFNVMALSIQEYNKEILRQLYYDKPTNLPNKKKLIIDIEDFKFPIIILINIDDFQEINDFFGNEVADKILIEVAIRLKKILIENSNLYKMIGDEFAILIDKNISENQIETVLKNSIIENIFLEINDKIFLINEQEINIRVTVGVSHNIKIIPSIDEIINKNNLLINADMSLRKAKQLQKHYLVYNEKMELSKEYENNIKWTREIKSAINDNRIVPYFQPIFNNRTNKIEKYECLVRLINKNGQIESPYKFLDVAKKTRLYPLITKIMITKSFNTFISTNFEFSINLSVYDILNEETNYFIKSKLLEYKILAHNVVFEILESDGIENYSKIIEFIDYVKSLGCKIAIDDFGSGYSSFEHILKLNVDYIKIDASMIKNIDTDINSQIITKTIVNFAKELKLKTISEFVHSKEVFNKVYELGVDYSQGYFLGEPMSNPYFSEGIIKK